MAYTSDRRLYLDRDGNVVEHDDPAAVRLLVGAGCDLSDADAERYGLVKAKQAAKAQEPAEDKAVAGPKAKKGGK